MELFMIFAGGLLGSSHCVSMCGAFTLMLNSRRSSLGGTLCRQLTYSLGRVFTYSTAGAAAGYGGRRLMTEFGNLGQLQALLLIAAGLLLVGLGLGAAGLYRVLLPSLRPWVPWSGRFRHASCLGPGLFAGILGAARLHSVFLGGVVNGLLPCGLVYAYLALAAGSGDMGRGWLIMALFGLGTLPLMILVGAGGSIMAPSKRRQLLHIAACCVILTGGLSLWRGVQLLQTGAEAGMSSVCPLCD